MSLKGEVRVKYDGCGEGNDLPDIVMLVMKDDWI